MPLFTDTAIFALTILRVIRYSKEAKLEPNSSVFLGLIL